MLEYLYKKNPLQLELHIQLTSDVVVEGAIIEYWFKYLSDIKHVESLVNANLASGEFQQVTYKIEHWESKKNLPIFIDFNGNLEKLEFLNPFIFTSIIDNYNSQGRYYHNITHLDYVLNKLYSLKNKLTFEQFCKVELALLYHDSVMNFKFDDVELSANLFVQDMYSLDNPPSPLFIEQVEKMIKSTAYQYTTPSPDFLTHLVMDIDLSILAESPENYKEYTSLIRKEYNDIDDLTFYKGRLDFLRTLYLTPDIFKTDIFKNLNSKAKSNICKEIKDIEIFLGNN